MTERLRKVVALVGEGEEVQLEKGDRVISARRKQPLGRAAYLVVIVEREGRVAEPEDAPNDLF